MRLPSSIQDWRSVTGWMMDEEGDYLASLASLLQPGQNIIELGTFQGRSTCALAFGCEASGAHLYTVDHFLGSKEHQDGGPQPSFEKTVQNLKRFDLLPYVTILPYSTKQAAWVLQGNLEAHMLLVDSGHEKDEVIEDVQNYWSLLSPDSHLLFHDIGTGIWTGVDDAVSYLLSALPLRAVHVEKTLLHTVRTDGNLNSYYYLQPAEHLT